MTFPISDVLRRVVYSGSAGLGPYSFSFEILAVTDIEVYKNSTLLTLTTDYTVTINANGTGSVTLVVAATGADNITLVGSRAIERTTDFVTGGDLFANTLNQELDSVVIFAQQVDEKADRGLKAPITDPTDINMELPVKATRRGKVLAFDETSGDPVAGPDLSAMTTVIAQSANINTVAANIGSVNTVAGNTSNVNTVAGISGNVTTVAGVAANVTTVAGISANVTSVAGNAANITAVAGNATNINAVAGNATNINAVAADATDIGTVATNIANVNAVGTNIAAVVAVDANATNINAVNSNATNINTVAGIAANVTTVAGIAANVTTVAGVSANVTTVAGISADVTAVATNNANVSTVATNIANVNTVAGLNTEIAALGARTVEIDGLFAELNEITTKVGKTSDTGSAIIPTGTEAQRDVSPVAGNFRFNTSVAKFEGYSGTAWGSVGSGATGGGSDEVFVQNARVVTTSYTIPGTVNAMSTGPITINDGVTVTVSDGARYVVI